MRAILVFLATLLFVAAPALSPHFAGYDPALFPVLIQRPAVQPAGYAFSLWGLIYVWLVVHAAFGLWRRADARWDKGWLTHVAALLLGSGWLALAGGYPRTATLVIIVMAACAVASFLTADRETDRWTLQAPLALFAGWLTAASMVSLGVILTGDGWLTNTGSAVAMLVAILVVAMSVQRLRPEMPVYSAAVIWAAIGIAVANWGADWTVAYAALAGAALQTGFAYRAFAPRPAA